MILLLPVAFIAGILTAFTPCALPVLPIILVGSLEKRSRTTGMIIGLVTFFVLAILFLSAIVKGLGISADDLRSGSILFLLIVGILLVFPALWEKVLSQIQTVYHPPIIAKEKGDFVGGFLTGGSLGAVWTPCVGPVVAAVTALTASSPFSLSSWLITTFYGAGIGFSLFFVAALTRRGVASLKFLKEQNQRLRRIFGGVVIITALSLSVGGDKALRSFALRVLPQGWTQAGSIFQDHPLIQRQLKQLRKDKDSRTYLGDNKQQITPSDLEQGCPRRDCIPSIDEPQFTSRIEADTWLQDSDVVFGIDYQGVVRAYPQRILNWHEIVNDTIAGDPIMITFCPLCGSAIAFERKVNGKKTEFGVSGKLYNSNLVMYDRLEENYWQQATGEAIIGPAADRHERLSQVSIATVTWGEWQEKFPDTQVLSRNTGFIRDYNLYPYGTYEENDQIYFGIQNTDRRLPLKEVVYGFEVEGRFKAYPEDVLHERERLDDSLADLEVSLTRLPSGEIKLIEKKSQKEYLPLRTFWFTWAAFHPDTELYASP